MNNPIPQCSPDSPEWAFRAAEMINELQDRHNALVDAVTRYFASFASEQKIGMDEMTDEEYHAWCTERIAARAEVDRLLEETK